MASLFSFSLLVLAFLLPRASFFSRRYGVGYRTKDAVHESIQQSGYSGSMRIDLARVIQLSWCPRTFLYEGFLSDEECDHLISLAQDKPKNLLVMDTATEKHISSGNRSSPAIFIAKVQDEIVTRIEDRIAAWTLLPKENGEWMQILHYGVGQKYDTHHDYLLDDSMLALSGNRIATVIMYLSNVTFGGETIFPLMESGESQVKEGRWSECAKIPYAVRPIKGNALLFFNLHLNATADKKSIHAGCPVIDGEKWSATKWIHVKSMDLVMQSSDDDECTDEDANCHQWAALGECQKNPVFMIGSPDYYGTCRKSCKVC